MKMFFLLSLTFVAISACSSNNQAETVPSNTEKKSFNKIDNKYVNLYRGNYKSDIGCSKNADCNVKKIPNHYYIDGFDIGNFKLSWLGHASFVLEYKRRTQILIDPVFSDFDWPINWLSYLAGIKRANHSDEIVTPASLEPDVILISHNHYDHLSNSSIEETKTESTSVFLPAGVVTDFNVEGVAIYEFLWYSSKVYGDLSFTFLPAHHYSGRYTVDIDGNESLWGGWLIESGEKSVYFSGDTGFSPVFEDLKPLLKGTDVCLLPIGSSYKKSYQSVHLTPGDALAVAKELECKILIPWGTGKYSWLMGEINSKERVKRLIKLYQSGSFNFSLKILRESY